MCVPAVSIAAANETAAEKLGICQSDDIDVKLRLAACDAVINVPSEPPHLRAEAHLNRGIIMEEGSNLDAALADFSAAIALNPEYPALYEHRGLANAKLGKGSAALDDLAAALRLSPEDAELHASRAVVRTLLGDDKGALIDLNEAIRIAPVDADHYARRGFIHWRLGSHAKAQSDSRRALELEPDNELASRTLGELRKRS